MMGRGGVWWRLRGGLGFCEGVGLVGEGGMEVGEGGTEVVNS